MWQKPERVKPTNDSCLKLQNGRSGFSETGSGFCRMCKANQQFMYDQRFGFSQIRSHHGREHTSARNGAAIIIQLCIVHVRNCLVMPRTRLRNATFMTLKAWIALS